MTNASARPARAPALLLACLALVGCAPQTAARFTPRVTNPDRQAVRPMPEEPVEAVHSQHARSRVTVTQAAPPALAGWGTPFSIVVTNVGQTEVPFAPTSIAVQQGGRSLEVWGVARVNEAIEARNRAARSRAIATAVLGGLVGGMAAIAPSATSGLTMATSLMLVDSADRSAQQVEVDGDAARPEVATAFLGDSVIQPRRRISGLVAVPGIDASLPVEVSVTVGEDRHDLRFEAVVANAAR
jgi:hypothetical protein